MKIIDDLTKGKTLFPIPIFNDVDEERNFYENNLFIFTSKIVTSVEEERTFDRNGCNCINGCFKGTCPCIDKSTVELFPGGRVKNVGELYNDFDNKTLYECNSKTCKCDGKCGHRMTPDEFNIRVELYKTPLAGYAVRAKQYIQSGTFISEFVGEILSYSDAYNRENIEEYSFNVWNEDYSESHFIDPTRYGNISRFYNHSCQPNLIPIRYYSSHRKNYPSLGFVALGDICPGDQMTISYGYEYWDKLITNKIDFFCQCDSFYCQYPPPDKPQLKDMESAINLARKLTEKNHKKFLKYQTKCLEKREEKIAPENC